MDILLLEDDPILGKGLKMSLELEGYRVSWAADLKSAAARAAEDAVSLYLLDWNLPDGTGLDFCRTIRETNGTVPIIFLTARIDEESAIAALSSGANDYVRKPFKQGELLARIRGALRESQVREEQLRFENLLLLLKSRRAVYRDTELDLSRREFDILAYLARHAGAVVSREDILRVIDKEGEIFDRTVDSHLSHLRSRLKSAKVDTIRISSVYGVGYKLERSEE